MTPNELIQKTKSVYNELKTNPKLSAFVFSKAMELEGFDLLTTIAVLEQNGEAENIFSPQTLRRLNLTQKPDARKFYIPSPTNVITFKRGDQTIPISQATKEEKLSVAKGEIKSENQVQYRWVVGYDIKDTDCPRENYPNYKNYHFNDVDHTQIYQNLSSFAESIGFKVIEDNISSLGLDGFYNEKTSEITVNSKLIVSNKIKTLCESLSKGIIEQTSTQVEDVQVFEEHLLSKSLQNLCQLPVDFKEMNFDVPNLNESFCRTMKATRYVADGITNQMDINRQNEQSHMVNKSVEIESNEITENFFQGLR